METTSEDGTKPGVAGTVAYRSARPEDAEAIAGLDGSFTTDSVYEVALTEEGFTVSRTPVTPPLRKVFPADDDTDDADDPRWSRTVVASDGDELCGFVETAFEPWNARLTICDIEVAPAWRGKGIGRALMQHAFALARETGAVNVWLEVSNVNAPAIQAYLRMGFVFCGLDTSLYDGTESAGETALFMARRVH
ncbi:GNAT family N-acetyltransferase [Streptomyces naphthomycinicus]|uniref:GNAT family N-acetyltransferase n=1 Tax=Streptomyces naphthomycinicus TaxID=2872625 RepID=UPI001CEC1497|nr:GNAT family N-acetyltransferase [Streptomyces sp. TML10]